MSKYLKVMFGNSSSADNSLKYRIDEVNVADNWNPCADDPKSMGGFNFSTEDKILRWLVRGDTIYEVEIPNDAEVIDCPSESAPHGVFRSNKIILHNPKSVTDDMVLDLYKKSNLPELSYYKALAGCAVRGYEKTCLEIIRDHVNNENIDLVLSEIADFVSSHDDNSSETMVYDKVMKYLNEIKSNLLISRFIDKDPYIKDITSDRIINLTGESGSGKSYYSNKYRNDDRYIVIDTDVVFSNKSSLDEESLKVREIFKDKTSSDLINDFDNCYEKILDYFEDRDKIIVIDSAQYRNMKDYSLLKGKVIVMRTSVEKCYERCLDRWKVMMGNYQVEDYQKYANKKLGMFNWYYSLNEFLKRVDKL